MNNKDRSSSEVDRVMTNTLLKRLDINFTSLPHQQQRLIFVSAQQSLHNHKQGFGYGSWEMWKSCRSRILFVVMGWHTPGEDETTFYKKVYIATNQFFIDFLLSILQQFQVGNFLKEMKMYRSNYLYLIGWRHWNQTHLARKGFIVELL